MSRNAPRTKSTSRALAQSLLLGLALTTGAAAASVTVMGCGGDPNDPLTHVEAMDDKLKRPAAVKRLILFYEDAMTKDKKDRSGPAVKSVLDKIVEPLVKVANSGELDTKLQGELLQFLSDTRDPRAMSALVKALDEYKPDDKRPEPYDKAMVEVVRNLGTMKAKEAAGPLLKLFTRLHASWPKAQNKAFYRIVYDAMLEIKDPSWEGELTKMLARPVKTLNTKKAKQLMDEVYWQTAAAHVLGELRAKAAVIPLIKVTLSPFKRNVHATAVGALIKIGKPAIIEGVKLLKGENAELIAYAEEQQLAAIKDQGNKVDKKAEAAAKTAYRKYAAAIVAEIGRAECIEPTLAALAAGDAATKSTIAVELFKLPANKDVTEAFKATWEKTPMGAQKETLTEVSGNFLDPELMRWVATSALKLKGDDAPYIQEKALVMTMKLASAKDWPLVTQLAGQKITYPKVTTLGKSLEAEIKASKELADKCGEKADCYLKELTDSANHKKKTQIKGIKAAYMVGSLGGTKMKTDLATAITKIDNAAVRFAALSALDRLSGAGATAEAKILQDYVDKVMASKDQKRIKAIAPVNKVIDRMRARAQ